MISIRTNITEALQGTIDGLKKLKDKEYLLRPLAIEVIPLMTERIHKNGLASDEKQIGKYSPEYMKVRTGNYGNSAKFTKGKNEGKRKDSGVYTRGDKAGQPRPKYNRNSDDTVIISLTRQLENDWSVIERDNGYAIGFLNELNFKKSQWVEATYKKKIFDLSKTEIKYVTDRINELTIQAIPT